MITPRDLFTLLSDETRLRCLFLLHKKSEICVCEFSLVLNSSQPKISRHLALLRQSGLVVDERRGQWVFYQINQQLPKWVKKILTTTLENLQELEPYKSDIETINTACKTNPCSN